VSADEYTLLIVESPVIARILQRVSPPHINIMATSGYCWKPEYRPKNHQLKARANPDSREFRKELKEQAQWAVKIVIATDADPSGDFLAWALSRFLKSPVILRSSVKSLNRIGVINSVQSAIQTDPASMYTRLMNRSMMRYEWASSQLPDIEISGLAAAFGSSHPFHTFADHDQLPFHSSQPVHTPHDQQIKAGAVPDETHYNLIHPLSTFEALEKTVQLKITNTRREAQQLLQDLFTDKHGLHHDSLISYPRTSVKGYSAETWQRLHTQYLKISGTQPFRPTAARSTLNGTVPHESIHPLSLSRTPEEVSGTLSSAFGKLYTMIYRHTIDSITIPRPSPCSYRSPSLPGSILFHDRPLESKYRSLTPVRTLPEIGQIMHQYGILSPSSFGTRSDRWISDGLIRIKNDFVVPGSALQSYLRRSSEFHNILSQLSAMEQDVNLTPATLRRLFTSK
jgi:hypothetical protein